ncbi:MAG: rhombosortase [Pseudomonadales bacterium]
MTGNKEWLSTDGAGIYVLLPLCVTLQSLPTEWGTSLLLQRDTFFAGQWWQLLSAHCVHLSWPHLGFNMVGLAVLQQLFGPQLAGWRCWLGLVFIAVVSAASLLAFSPAVQWYGGFSGVLTGMYVYAAIRVLRHQVLLGSAVLCIIGAKIIAEQWQGATIDYSSLSAIPVVVDAHLYGALAGAAYAALTLTMVNIKRG